MNREEIYARSSDLCRRFENMVKGEQVPVILNTAFTLFTYYAKALSSKDRAALMEDVLEVLAEHELGERNETNVSH